MKTKFLAFFSQLTVPMILNQCYSLKQRFKRQLESVKAKENLCKKTF